MIRFHRGTDSFSLTWGIACDPPAPLHQERTACKRPHMHPAEHWNTKPPTPTPSLQPPDETLPLSPFQCSSLSPYFLSPRFSFPPSKKVAPLSEESTKTSQSRGRCHNKQKQHSSPPENLIRSHWFMLWMEAEYPEMGSSNKATDSETWAFTIKPYTSLSFCCHLETGLLPLQDDTVHHCTSAFKGFFHVANSFARLPGQWFFSVWLRVESWACTMREHHECLECSVFYLFKRHLSEAASAELHARCIQGEHLVPNSIRILFVCS